MLETWECIEGINDSEFVDSDFNPIKENIEESDYEIAKKIEEMEDHQLALQLDRSLNVVHRPDNGSETKRAKKSSCLLM